MDQVGFEENGIDYQEFLTAAVDKRKIINEKSVKMAFELFDIDGSGDIDISEFRAILPERKLKPPPVTFDKAKAEKPLGTATDAIGGFGQRSGELEAFADLGETLKNYGVKRRNTITDLEEVEIGHEER